MGKLEKELEKAAERGATSPEIEKIARKCQRKAKNSSPRYQEAEYKGCVVDELEELNEDLE